MQTVTLQEKNIPVVGCYDTVIAGGGTAGCFAALSALKEGLSVLILEQSGGVGGMSCAGLVTTAMPSHVPDGSLRERYRSSLLYAPLIGALEASGDAEIYPYGSMGFNPERMEEVLETAIVEGGGRILFHTTLIDAVKDGNRIRYAVFYNKGGLAAVEAKVFIDCTGDADLCVMAGVPTESGNRDGVNQNISLRFEMAQVDIPVYEAFMDKLEHSPGGRDAFMRQKYEEGYLREEDIYHFQTFHIPGKPNCLSFNCPELGRGVNVIDPWYQSEKQTYGKQAVFKLARFVKECVPGFEHAFISKISPMLGIRDSRRIRAEYMLTADDVFSFRKFRDGIAASNYPLDAHGEKDYGKGSGTYDPAVPAGERYYEIPLRCLIPVGVDNLLCAGRCIGTDFLTQSTTRVQFTCQYTGEAAGIAAHYAVRDGLPLREIDGLSVRRVMASRGDVLLKKEYNE